MLEEKLETIFPLIRQLKNDEIYGMQFGSFVQDKNFHRIILCIDPTIKVILQAKKMNAHLIISHHSLIQLPTTKIQDSIINQINLLSMSNISLFLIHDCINLVKHGFSEKLAQMAGFKILDRFYSEKGRKIIPIGLVCKSNQNEITFLKLLENLKRIFNLKCISYCGNENVIIDQVIVANGNGISAKNFLAIKKIGVNTILSGEFIYSDFISARSLGINLISLNHYLSEKFGMENLRNILSLEFPRDEFIYLDSEDPISII